MALKAPVREHTRQTTVVFNPEQTKKHDLNYSVPMKKRVAAYARVSTELDAQQNSYEAQIEYYTGYIKGKPDWEFVGIYADEGLSGTSYKKRDGFNRMLDDARSGKLDLILTKSISRFSRNTVDSLTVTRELKSIGVEVFFEKENISSMDTNAELIFTILSSAAQEESRSISENVLWGIERNMEAGKINLPYKSFLGYKKGADGLPEIVEEEAVIIRRIYKRFLAGDSLSTIAHDLTADGIETPRGKKQWTKDGVRRILTNEKYKGEAILGKTYTASFLTKEVRKNNGERKQWHITDSHDAIISPEMFELVQLELKRRTGRGGRFYDSPFTGKIICGECGEYYGHKIRHCNEPCRKEVWYCNDKYKGSSTCKTSTITAREVENAFIYIMNNMIRMKDLYLEGYKRDILPLIGDTSELKKEELEVANQLNDLTAEIEKLIQDNARNAQDQTVYTEKYRMLCDKLDEKKLRLQELRQQISDTLSRRENVEIFINNLSKIDSLLKEFDIPTWHAMIDYVTAMPNRIIVFHFRDGQEQTVDLEKVH